MEQRISDNEYIIEKVNYKNISEKMLTNIFPIAKKKNQEIRNTMERPKLRIKGIEKRRISAQMYRKYIQQNH